MFGETGRDQGKGAKASPCLGVAMMQAAVLTEVLPVICHRDTDRVAPSLPSASVNSLKSVPCQVAVRSWLSLGALLPVLCKRDNPIQLSSRHMWEANEK